MKMILSIFENMAGLIDGDLPQVLQLMGEQLSISLSDNSNTEYARYKLKILEAFSMSFYYNN